MTAVFQSVSSGPLRSVDLVLSPGRYVVLSNESAALCSFVALAAGRIAPRFGGVALDGVAPVTSPVARRRIAALFEDEALPPARSVELSLGRALSARGERAERALAVLTAAGMAQLARQAPGALSAAETRSLALTLALAHESASLLVLHEPLTTQLERRFVLAALARHTDRGAIVVATTSSTTDANLLGGTWLCVELGRLAQAPAATPRLGQGPWQQVVVDASDARALSLLLHESALGLTTELTGATAQLKVSGPSLDDTVREIISAARRGEIEIQRIEPALPPVEALMAARAGFARGAYEASRVAAHGAGTAAASVRYGGGNP